MVKASKRIKAPTEPIPSTSLFQVDTAGDNSVRQSLQHAASSSGAATGGRLRKGESFNKPLKSDQILAARSNVAAISSRKVPNALTVIKKDQEKAGRVDRATKERLKRMTGRDGQGSGLWSVKSGAPREELETAAMKSAGEYDAWEVIVEPIVVGEDLALKAIVKENTTRVIPKVSRRVVLLLESSV